MIPKPLITREETHLFPLMEVQMLRKAVSDAYFELDKIGKDLETIAKIDEVLEQAECECCGLKEDCTQDYIIKVKNTYSGKWVCGLCSEAVKEKLKRRPRTAMEEAVRAHRNFCQEYNNSRINPELSLIWAIRDIARRSSANRNSKNSSATKLPRSTSCVPRIDVNVN